MKKALALLLSAALLCVLLAGCNSNNETIEVYLNANFPPFEYMEGNEIKGVDVDIAREIAKDLGKEVTFKNADFDGLCTSIASGKGDMAISGITITADRMEEVDFSKPYIKSVQYLILPDASTIAKMEDLAGKRVGAPVGYTGQLRISDEMEKGVLKDTDTNLKTYKSAIEASQDILNGKLDAVVMDELVAQSIAEDTDGLKAIKLVYADGSAVEEEYGVAVKKGQEDLLEKINATIDRLVSEGKIDEFVINHGK